jgi:mannose-6-phosphate isomerase-like protein (cupin superfamily)
MRIRPSIGKLVQGAALLAIGIGVLDGAAPLVRAARADPPAVLDALFDGERRNEPLSDLAGKIELAPGEEYRVDEIDRDEHTSHHLVAIRNAEVPHRHDVHDLWVVVLRGHGTMLLGTEVHPVGEGSILYVPRGTLHAFNNTSRAPAVAYAVYSPAFDGKDRVVAE